MADDTPEPVTQTEPVALLDIAKAIVAVAGFAGLELAENLVLDVLVGVNAVFLLVAATLATRRRVTPEVRAKKREVEAFQRGAARAAGFDTTVDTSRGVPARDLLLDVAHTHVDPFDDATPPEPPDAGHDA